MLKLIEIELFSLGEDCNKENKILMEHRGNYFRYL